jgi:hypothetical protein
MRGRWAVGLICAVFATGCLTPDAANRTMMDRLRAVGGPTGPDVVVFDVAEIELPPADKYIDDDLWAGLDENAIGLEHKAALDDNGLRVGVVGGLPPGKLQALLHSDRTCPNPRRITMRAGNAKNLLLGSPHAETAYDVRIAGQTKSLTLHSAHAGFAVTPGRTTDGRVTLHFVPQVQHGGRSIFLQPAEGEGWALGGQKPTERYAELGFTVTLAPAEYVVIGTRYDRMRTLGHVTFVGTSQDRPVQRILVIRARPQGDSPTPDWTVASGPRSGAPLALQAVKTTRGSRD